VIEIIKLQPHELELIQILVKGSPFAHEVIDNVINAKVVSLDFTEVGYFLTLSHPKFPLERYVLNDPYVSGAFENEECGFLIFIENNELMIECHTSQDVLPKSFRANPVALTVS